MTGASSGIGRACARRLVREGFLTFGGHRKPEDGDALRALGVHPLRLDVTRDADVTGARATIREELGGEPLFGLVNNAGVPGAGPVEAVPLDHVRRVLEVNVLGVLRVTQALLPDLRRAGGRVVMMSSLSGRVPLPFAGPYAASKFALEALSDSLRREVLPFGVEVSVVEPGPVATPIWDRVEELDVSAYEGTPYEGAVARTRAGAVEAGARGLPPETVAEAVVEALTADRPPTRTLVADRATTLRFRLARWLPDRWADRLMARRAWR